MPYIQEMTQTTIYVKKKKKEERGLARLDDDVDASIRRLEDNIKSAKED